MSSLNDELAPVIRPGWALPATMPEFRNWLRDYFSVPILPEDAPLAAKARAFLRLPAANDMPPGLRVEVEELAQAGS